MAEGDRASERGFEEIRTLSNEPGSDMTPFPQGVLCMPTELDPSFHAQPVNSLDTAPHAQTQTEATSSMLAPSSHVENVDLAFPELADLLHDSTSIGNNRCSLSLDALSLFDPSSHAQNIHFTTLNPTEHVQACAFGPLAQLYAPLMPVDTSLDPRNTTYPIINTADYDSSTSVGRTARLSEIMTQDFAPPEHTSPQQTRSMETTIDMFN